MSLLSIVIPAFNESDYILTTLGRIQKTVKTNFECLVVVDSPDDSTISHVSNLSKSDPKFQIILNDLGNGPAYAIKKGIYKANGNFIAIVSGDGSDDVNQIDDLVRLVERGVSVAVASRHMKGGQLVGSPFLKGWLSKIAGQSLFHISRVGTHDSTNNFKVYDKVFLDSIVIESIHGFELGLELICKAKQKKLRIAEIPTIWIERSEGVSKFPLVKSLPKYMFWYLKIVLKF